MKNLFRSTVARLLAAIIVGLAMTACAAQENEENEADEEEESVFSVKKDKATYYKVKHVDLGDGTINVAMAKSGKDVFDMKCTSCHKYDERYVGPALGKVAERRTPEYIMNMILDTETMIDNDDTVKCLLQEYLMRMPNQSVDEKDARNVLEHLREYANKK